MFARLGRLTVHRRRLVLALTALFLVVSALAGGGVFDALKGGGFQDPHAESTQARDLLQERFGQGDPNVVLLYTAPDGDVDSPASVAAGEALTERLAAEPGVTQAASYWSLGKVAPLRSKGSDKALAIAFVQGDEDQVKEVADGVRSEIPDTVAHVVNDDLAIATLYTSPETVRSKAVEMLYRREQVDATEAQSIASAETWTQDHAWSARTEAYPGMHAGLLSTPAFIYMTDDPRSRLRIYYESMWCSTAASVDVNAHDIFALDAVDLRAGDGWQRLAKMPICTNCHARLDYGMQFFRGYPYVYSSRHIAASAYTGDRGPLYGDDINDFRGEAVRSPRGFAELAVKQPEFESCIAKRVAAYVFGAERFSLSPQMLKACEFVIRIPTRFSINVGMAGAIVLYDRMLNLGGYGDRPVKTGGVGGQPPPAHTWGAPLAKPRT